MKSNEKAELLAFLDDAARWCRDAEARNSAGDAVHFDDEGAVAWDITGAVCRLFGWDRSQAIFEHMGRHMLEAAVTSPFTNDAPGIDAMRALQDFNDHTDTNYETMRTRIENIPVNVAD
ncbi:MAG: hypothetical protein ACPGXK_08870 [Phycisphaerae bacterium]